MRVPGDSGDPWEVQEIQEVPGRSRRVQEVRRFVLIYSIPHTLHEHDGLLVPILASRKLNDVNYAMSTNSPLESCKLKIPFMNQVLKIQ